MLQAIRNRAQGIFAWVILIVIGVPFALWGIQNYMDTGKEKPVATVGDRDFFERDVNRVYQENLANLVGLGQVDESQLKREALDRLIREELIAQQARDKGFAVGDEDVRSFVQSLPYFQVDGKFDKERYKLMLSSQGMSAAQFAEQIRKSLTTEQFQRGFTDTAFVTKRDIDEFYRLRNQERAIEYVTVPVKKGESPIPDQEVEAYYQSHQDQFQNPEKVSVQYLAISLDDIAATIKPGEEELKNLYEEQKAQLTTAERRKVSHILIAPGAETPDADKQALDKLTKLRDRLQKGEDFAKLAKENSEDKISAEKGGDLGYINKDTMDPAFSSASFTLQKGEISQPVKTSFGYHLIKVVEIDKPTTKSYDEVKADLAKTFQRSSAEAKFYEMGQTMTEQSFEHPDSLEPAAAALNLKIAETGLFTKEAGEGIAAEKAVREAAFAEDVINGKNSEPVEIGNEKAYVLRIKEHQPASTRSLAEVKPEVIAKLRDEKARADAQQHAMRLLGDLKEGKALADVAKAAGLPVQRPAAFKRGVDTVPAPLSLAVFKAARPGTEKREPGLVVLDNGDQVIFNVLAITDGSTAKVDPKELDMARDYLLKNYGQADFSAFVAQLRETADVYIRPER